MAGFSTTLRRKQLDESLQDLKQRVPPIPPRGYIREIRDALGMSSYQLADRMGISQPSVNELEGSERDGRISLNSLQRAAEAMGCRLVYGMVPIESLEHTVSKQAYQQAEDVSRTIFRTMALEQQKTSSAEEKRLISELADEYMRRGKSALWKTRNGSKRSSP